MLVFKFGGASVKTAEAVKNVGKIVESYPDNIIIVISAMGKSTNDLEVIAQKYYQTEYNDFDTNVQLFSDTSRGEFDSPLDNANGLWDAFEKLRAFHFRIVNQLIPNPKNKIFAAINRIFDSLLIRLRQAPSLDFNFEYDQIVAYGEILSTKIISLYLNEIGLKNEWFDIRKHLKTNAEHRDAEVDWKLSEKLLRENIQFNDSRLIITQGFIGSTLNNQTTTLGREGSDYTAAILSHIFDAEKMIVWKDVTGIFNADPKLFDDACKIDFLSYEEAVELAYYGAKVIHPKTIKPLHNKQIPLFVNSFKNPTEQGTIIHSADKIELLNGNKPAIPIFTIKDNQEIITIESKDLSFISEADSVKITQLFVDFHKPINLIQKSAIGIMFCVDTSESASFSIREKLEENYNVKIQSSLNLLTITNFTPEAIAKMTTDKKIIIQQINCRKAQFVY